MIDIASPGFEGYMIENVIGFMFLYVYVSPGPMFLKLLKTIIDLCGTPIRYQENSTILGLEQLMTSISVKQEKTIPTWYILLQSNMIPSEFMMNCRAMCAAPKQLLYDSEFTLTL